MNKLYIINWTLENGYVFETTTFWTERGINDKMKLNPEWRFRLKEDNDCHMIYEAY